MGPLWYRDADVVTRCVFTTWRARDYAWRAHLWGKGHGCIRGKSDMTRFGAWPFEVGSLVPMVALHVMKPTCSYYSLSYLPEMADEKHLSELRTMNNLNYGKYELLKVGLSLGIDVFFWIWTRHTTTHYIWIHVSIISLHSQFVCESTSVVAGVVVVVAAVCLLPVGYKRMVFCLVDLWVKMAGHRAKGFGFGFQQTIAMNNYGQEPIVVY